jgi:hypothetical protein
LLAATAWADSAYASRQILNVTVNGGNSVTVLPNASVTVRVSVRLTGSSTWGSTHWLFAGQAGHCLDLPEPNISTNGDWWREFTVTAPATPSTYYLYVYVARDDNCNEGQAYFWSDRTITVKQCLGDSDCNDGNFCNGQETCVAGACVPGTAPCEPGHCDDDADTCLECVGNDECDDGLFCNGEETCVDGSCQPGTPPCDAAHCDDDANICKECVGNDECSDGLFCNGEETCVDGSCQPGTPPCILADHCDEDADTCLECVSDAECSDGLFCNGEETCVAGACQPGTPPSCDDGLSCTTDSCDPTAGSTLRDAAGGACVHEINAGSCLIDGVCYADGDTNPSNPCESCNLNLSNTAWSPKANGASCSDGLFCNGEEVCFNSTCWPGTPPSCDDGLTCTADSCDPTAGTDLRDPVTGACVHEINAGSCLIEGVCYVDGDTNPANVCQVCNASLSNTAWSPKANGTSCSDGLFCNGAETCVDGACTPGTPPCVDNAHCDENAATCLACISNTECDDGDACTDDACVNHQCVETPIAGCCDADAECDDGDPCTIDTCNGNTCTHTPAPDADNDGVCDAIDQCPDTPAGETANAQGCSASQLTPAGEPTVDPNTPSADDLSQCCGNGACGIGTGFTMMFMLVSMVIMKGRMRNRRR